MAVPHQLLTVAWTAARNAEALHADLRRQDVLKAQSHLYELTGQLKELTTWVDVQVDELRAASEPDTTESPYSRQLPEPQNSYDDFRRV